MAGMAAFAQGTDMSFYFDEFSRPGATFFNQLDVLNMVQSEKLTGTGEFYHNALVILLGRVPDIITRDERVAAETSARIISRELASEKYTAAAPDLWRLVQNFDVIRGINDGLVMQDALVAMGQVGAKEFVPHIAQRLHTFNVNQISDAPSRRRVELGVMGAISALEALKEPEGFKSVFFASIGWYEPSVRVMASVALPNIVNDPGEIISEIIRDPSNDPRVKYEAWREMLRTNAPNSSKAKVAAVALATGWTYSTSNVGFQRNLRDMRISAIDIIRQMGVEDNSVYANLEKSYKNSFVNVNPDYDEIRKALGALSAAGTDEAVRLLVDFLRELHLRRRSGPWGNREREVLQMLVPALGATRTTSQPARQLLGTIQGSSDYTSVEQGWARDALRLLQ